MTAFTRWVASRFPRLPLFPPITPHLHTTRVLDTQPSRLPVPVGRHPGHCLLVTAPSAHHTTPHHTTNHTTPHHTTPHHTPHHTTHHTTPHHTTPHHTTPHHTTPHHTTPHHTMPHYTTPHMTRFLECAQQMLRPTFLRDLEAPGPSAIDIASRRGIRPLLSIVTAPDRPGNPLWSHGGNSQFGAEPPTRRLATEPLPGAAEERALRRCASGHVCAPLA